MAANNTQQIALSTETTDWLATRSAVRTALSTAFANSAASGTSIPTVEVLWNELFAAVNAAPYQSLPKGLYGYPKAEDMIDEYVTKVKKSAPGTSTTNFTMTESMCYSLQINMIESFRRMYMSSRQRKKHMLQHWIYLLFQDDFLKNEIEQIMLGKDPNTPAV